MNFIKKIFDNNIDEDVHLQFQKFSKGEFRNRALIRAKKTGKGFTINTSAEFANELVRIFSEKLGERRTNIKGAIISTSDLTGELEFQEKKQFQGVKRYILDKEMSGNEILNLLDNFQKSFFALSFKVGEDELKIKPKAPKSGKPGKGNEKPKADFCKLKTTNLEIGKSFIFEKQDFKNADINHTFLINEIIIPEELKNAKNLQANFGATKSKTAPTRRKQEDFVGEKDFAKIREFAKRKGKIIREAEIDGQIIKSEKEFVA